MYIPAHTRLESFPAILDLLRTKSFATLVVNGISGPEAVHIPVIVLSEEPLILAGHVAKANPIWKVFDGECQALIMFMGPHGYISPSMYESRPNVPTWNYVAVHAYGAPRLVEDLSEVVSHLREMVEFFDPTLGETQPESLREEFISRMSPGVVVFQMPVLKLEAKHKMSQNKPNQDRDLVIKSLSAGGAPDQVELAEWMKTR